MNEQSQSKDKPLILAKLNAGVGQQPSPYLHSLEEQSDEEEVVGVPNAGDEAGNEEDVLGSSDDDGPVKVLGDEVYAPSPSKKRRRVQETMGAEKGSGLPQVEHEAGWKKIQHAEDKLTELLIDLPRKEQEGKFTNEDQNGRSHFQNDQDLRQGDVSIGNQFSHLPSNQSNSNPLTKTPPKNTLRDYQELISDEDNVESSRYRNNKNSKKFMKQIYKESLNLIPGSSEDENRPPKLHTDLSDHNTFMMSPGSLTGEPQLAKRTTSKTKSRGTT